jgi:deoxyadenosine/deoxycytidine kinase
MLISIEGNVGSGKSTLLAEVEGLLRERMEADDYDLVYEPVDKWCSPVLHDGSSMLHSFYTDRKANAIPFQMYAMLTRFQQLQRVHKTVVVTERSIQSQNRVFAKPMATNGIISESQWFMYKEWYSEVTKSAPLNAVIYVDTPTEVCYDRVNLRSRLHGEDTITTEMLGAMADSHSAFIEWCNKHGIRVLVIDGLKDAKENAAIVLSWIQDCRSFLD